jgi:glutamyl-tRNA synthetase
VVAVSLDYDDKVAKKQLKEAAVAPLSKVKAKLAELDDWNQQAIHDVVHGVAEALELKMGKVGMPLRIALTNGRPSPSIDTIIYLLGKERTLRRIDKALDYVAQHETENKA